MIEINITRFVRNAGMIDYFASVAEIGANAGPATWRRACEDSPEYTMLATDDQREAYRAHILAYGAWEPEEIAAWSDGEINALLMQEIAGDVREIESLCGGIPGSPEFDAQEYESLTYDGTLSGRLFVGSDGEIYYYIGE